MKPMLPRYVRRRKLLPMPTHARAQIVELVFHEDRDVAELASVELLDRSGHNVIQVHDGDALVVLQRSWLDLVMPRACGVTWTVRSACRQRWARLSTRVPSIEWRGLAS